MSIYQKLGAIQKELIAPKGQYNSFGKYSYRSCEDILKAIKPLCEAQNTVLYISNDLQQMGDRIYVKAVVKLVDLESGEMVESVAHAREEETKKGADGSQITGASSSYARKYALAGLFCIDNEKDSDATNDGKTENADTQPATEEMKNALIEKMTAMGKAFKPGYNINSLTKGEYSRWMKALKAEEKK